MSEPDLVQQRYAEVSYPGGAFARTHPARLAAIAGLFGLETPPVGTARVLELGCAQGFNLLSMAAHLPAAHFTGLDFSEQEIARGRQLANEAGLGNVELLCADLRTFAPEPGSFYFIIAHGLLSWVPDDVKEALFAVCARALAPDGLALISYNTYPGWKQREAVRELMLLHLLTAWTPASALPPLIRPWTPSRTFLPAAPKATLRSTGKSLPQCAKSRRVIFITTTSMA